MFQVRAELSDITACSVRSLKKADEERIGRGLTRGVISAGDELGSEPESGDEQQDAVTEFEQENKMDEDDENGVQGKYYDDEVDQETEEPEEQGGGVVKIV